MQPCSSSAVIDAFKQDASAARTEVNSRSACSDREKDVKHDSAMLFFATTEACSAAAFRGSQKTESEGTGSQAAAYTFHQDRAIDQHTLEPLLCCKGGDQPRPYPSTPDHLAVSLPSPPYNFKLVSTLLV